MGTRCALLSTLAGGPAALHSLMLLGGLQGTQCSRKPLHGLGLDRSSPRAPDGPTHPCFGGPLTLKPAVDGLRREAKLHGEGFDQPAARADEAVTLRSPPEPVWPSVGQRVTMLVEERCLGKRVHGD